MVVPPLVLINIIGVIEIYLLGCLYLARSKFHLIFGTGQGRRKSGTKTRLFPIDLSYINRKFAKNVHFHRY
jgi:hypothetical protein